MSGELDSVIFGLPAAIGMAALCLLAWQRFGWLLRRRMLSLALRPTERMSSSQLSGYLLSAHLAVIALDDFNQLASALKPRRAAQLLRRRWNLKSAIECRRSIELGLGQLAALPPEAQAWEIQQLAYITRLGFAVGYVSREMAESIMARLQFAARAHHETWRDYLRASLASARRAGHALDAIEWRRFEHSHDMLLHAPESPVRRVGLSGQVQARSPDRAEAVPTT